MICNRMRVFALSTAFAIICFAPPAIAAQFDGNWSMVAVITSGHCGRFLLALELVTAEFFPLVDVSLATRFSWSGAFPPLGRYG